MRALVALLIALPLVASAQGPAPTLRSTTSEVLLDLVVRDKDARIVRNLRPEEVQVFEDGVPQKLRSFEFFDGHTAAEASPAPKAAAASGSSQTCAKTEPLTVNELREISLVSVVIADIDPRGRKVTMDAMRDFVQHQMAPNTYVGVFTLGMAGLRAVQSYTDNAEQISSAVDRASRAAMLGQLTNTSQLSMPDTAFGSAVSEALNPEGTEAAPGGATNATNASANGEAALASQMMETSLVTEMHDVYQDSMHYLSALHGLVQAQAGIPGRKVVLLFSAGLPVHQDSVELLRSVISSANRSNVTVYAVDTLGYTSESTLENSRRLLTTAVNASRRQQLALVSGGDQSVTPSEVLANEMSDASVHSDTMANLAELAEGTGGALLPPSLDMREPLTRAMEDVKTHYELSYSPSNASMDGSFRRITVKVSRRGARVFAREGYYAVPIIDGKEAYPFEVATLKALNTKPQLHQFDFQVSALKFRSEPNGIQLAYVFQAPASDFTITKEGPWAKLHVDITALVKNDQGQVIDKISKDISYKIPAEKIPMLERGKVSFTTPFVVPPGNYTLETAAIDRQSMKASVSRSPLVVAPDTAFSMSDVTVARSIDDAAGAQNPADPLQARGGKVTPELSSALLPDASGRVKFFAVGYPPAPIDAPVDANIEIWRDGRLVMRTPASVVPPDPSGAAPIVVSLVTKYLPFGHYEARVFFQYKGQKVAKSVDFTLAGPS